MAAKCPLRQSYASALSPEIVNGGSPMYDLLITNGLVIDGTGSAPYRADVAVSQGDIVAIGSLPGTAQHTLDAAGLVIVPGCIDLHTHSDICFLLDPTAKSEVRQ